MQQREIKGSHAWKRGIRAYTAHVGSCKYCKRPCNTYWKPNRKEKPVFACSQECANKLKEV